MGHGVVLVVVATGAFHSQTEKGRAEGMHPVGYVLDAEFFRHASTFDFLRVQTVEAGGEDLVPGGVGNEVSGDLLGDEVVVGLVLAEGLNDPIPPGPDVSIAVDLIPVGI